MSDGDGIIGELIASNSSTVAFVMVLLYDHVLTFADEVEFIWKQEMNMGKILFLINRYLPAIDLVILLNSYTNRYLHGDKLFVLPICLPWFQVDSWLGIISIIVIDLLMLLRTWALWKRSRKILIFLIVLFIVCMLAGCGATLYASIAVQEMPTPGNIRPCAAGFARTDILYALWISIIVYDTAIVALTFASLRFYNHTHGIPILENVLKDGIQYFLIICVISFANVVVINSAPPALATMLFTFHRVMISTLGCRMVLNLRGMLLRPGYNREETELTVFTTKDDRNTDISLPPSFLPTFDISEDT